MATPVPFFRPEIAEEEIEEATEVLSYDKHQEAEVPFRQKLHAVTRQPA